eukprot:scaffold624_cov176-Amphora_coffeaeformis.AAC.3
MAVELSSSYSSSSSSPHDEDDDENMNQDIRDNNDDESSHTDEHSRGSPRAGPHATLNARDHTYLPGVCHALGSHPEDTGNNGGCITHEPFWLICWQTAELLPPSPWGFGPSCRNLRPCRHVIDDNDLRPSPVVTTMTTTTAAAAAAAIVVALVVTANSSGNDNKDGYNNDIRGHVSVWDRIDYDGYQSGYSKN